MSKEGKKIYDFCSSLFGINRSITGDGVRQTLGLIQKQIQSNLDVTEIESKTKCFDWHIPLEWNVKDAFIEDLSGNRIIDFKKNNVHLMGYSIPVDKKISLTELKNHLYSISDMPNAIPYITSYYQKNWGFCISENQRKNINEDFYHVKIDASLEKGSLTYGEVLISGKSKKEIVFSTYICHPSLANDNLSGPSLATFLIKYLEKAKKPKYSYRFIFIPETIGAVAYLHKNLELMRRRTKAGFILTCVGDDLCYSFLESKFKNSIADQVARHVLDKMNIEYKLYSFLDRGSDERQYSSPGIDIPFCSVMRSKYGEFDEYHTSLDNLDFISPTGFQGSFDLYTKIIDIFEKNNTYKNLVLCEPQLGKRGLYPQISTKKTINEVKNLKNLIAYSDGHNSLLEIADIMNVPIWELYSLTEKLVKAKLIEKVDG